MRPPLKHGANSMGGPASSASCTWGRSASNQTAGASASFISCPPNCVMPMTETVAWVLIGSVLVIALAYVFQWRLFRRTLVAKDGTIQSLRSIIAMQHESLDKLVHSTWAQAASADG